MREILFRGQHRKYGAKVNMAGEKLPGIWVYGGIFPGTGDYSIIYGGKNENFTGAELNKWPVYSDTVGQYTGLTDKNGKKIFEGDIMKFGRVIRTVVFDEEYADFEFCRRDNVENPDGDTLCCDHDIFEIIGNIHDNPELLGNTP